MKVIVFIDSFSAQNTQLQALALNLEKLGCDVDCWDSRGWTAAAAAAATDIVPDKVIVMAGDQKYSDIATYYDDAGVLITLEAQTVASVTTDDGGHTYTGVPVVAFTGGGGSGAAGTAVLDGGTSGLVTSVTMTHGGHGYTSAPTVSFTPAGATGTAVMDGSYALICDTVEFTGANISDGSMARYMVMKSKTVPAAPGAPGDATAAIDPLA